MTEHRTDFVSLGRRHAEEISLEMFGLALRGAPTIEIGLWTVDLVRDILPAKAAAVRATGASEEEARTYLLALCETLVARIEAARTPTPVVQ